MLEKPTEPAATQFSTNPGINFITLKDRDDLGIKYYGRANVMSDQNRYAVIVANEMIPKGSVQYTFNIPIACMAWMQIGYGCFIVMPYFEHHAVRFLKNVGNCVFLDLRIFPLRISDTCPKCLGACKNPFSSIHLSLNTFER